MSFGLAHTQRVFTAAVFDPALVVPAGVRDRSSRRAASAFAVYRNNVAASLINVLRARFPVIVRMIGEDSFQAQALRFITLSPPRSPVLLGYGEAFPEFLRGTSAPSAEYLSDIARLEVACGFAYHAVDAEPLAADRFAELVPEQLPSLRAVLHPSITLLRSSLPVVSAWKANQPGTDEAIRCWTAEDAVVARPRNEVMVLLLPGGGFAFLSALSAGSTLATAIKAALRDHAAFDLVANLALLTGSGLVTGLTW